MALLSDGVPDPLPVPLQASAKGMGDERVRLLEEAAELLREGDSRLAYLEVVAALGAARRAAGDAEGARATLAAAVALAQRLGAAGIERRALAGLIEAGGRPRRTRAAGPEALTPAERQTVGLAVRGLKNREIAEARAVTSKTVETHLSSAYRKLGIRSRAQLAGVLHGQPEVTASQAQRPPQGFP